MSITIRDVARAAGVSTATVSRALRGLPNVDQATRDKVMAVAAELDYVVSPSASRLASGRTGSIGVITPHISRWFFSTVLSGAEAALKAAGLDLILMSVGDPGGELSMPAAQRLRRRVDGVLIIQLPPDDPDLHEVLNLELPTCLVGTSIDHTSSVCIDDIEAGRIATQHLLNLGHTRIGIIGGRPSDGPHTTSFGRDRGYFNAMTEAGLEPDPMLESYGYFTTDGGEKAMSALLAQRQPPTAVFAMSDDMAYGALRSLASHGMTPGKDVSVVGIDGNDMSALLNLTTVVQPVFDMGVRAADSLLRQLIDPESAEVTAELLPTHLAVRESTGALKP